MPAPNRWISTYEQMLDAAGFDLRDFYELALESYEQHTDSEFGGVAVDIDGFMAGFLRAAAIFSDDDHGDQSPGPVPTAPFDEVLA